MEGFLNIDKPADMTSHDVVDHVRKKFGTRRVGHGGTLDPFATGVLIVAVGSATKQLRHILELPKTYEATIVLGATSDTDDITGNIAKAQKTKTKQITMSQIKNTIKHFLGTIRQIPPIYSAVKVRGKKLYELAHAGRYEEAQKLAQQAVRTVHVYGIEILAYEYPELKLRITCGSGTYIRTLAKDIGESLGTGAYVQALRRTAIGEYRIEDAVRLEDI